MSTTVGELVYALKIDDSGMRAGIGQANRELQQAGNQGAASIDKIGHSATGAGNALKALGGIAAGLGIAAILKDTIMAASEFQDTIAATGVIFNEQAAAMENWSKTMASGFGVSAQNALESADKFGVFATKAGLAGDEVARFSQALVERGADLASMYGGTATDAVRSLSSALMGEAEPAKKYAILMSENAIKAQAMADNIWDGSGALTEQQKILARYNFILKESAIAQGDFARTAEDPKNAMEALKAEIANLQADLGTELLPLMKDLLGVAKDLLTFIKDNKEAVKFFAELAAAMWLVTKAAAVWKALVPKLLADNAAQMASNAALATSNTTLAASYAEVAAAASAASLAQAKHQGATFTQGASGLFVPGMAGGAAAPAVAGPAAAVGKMGQFTTVLGNATKGIGALARAAGPAAGALAAFSAIGAMRSVGDIANHSDEAAKYATDWGGGGDLGTAYSIFGNFMGNFLSTVPLVNGWTEDALGMSWDQILNAPQANAEADKVAEEQYKKYSEQTKKRTEKEEQLRRALEAGDISLAQYTENMHASILAVDIASLSQENMVKNWTEIAEKAKGLFDSKNWIGEAPSDTRTETVKGKNGKSKEVEVLNGLTKEELLGNLQDNIKYESRINKNLKRAERIGGVRRDENGNPERYESGLHEGEVISRWTKDTWDLLATQNAATLDQIFSGTDKEVKAFIDSIDQNLAKGAKLDVYRSELTQGMIGLFDWIDEEGGTMAYESGFGMGREVARGMRQGIFEIGPDFLPSFAAPNLSAADRSQIVYSQNAYVTPNGNVAVTTKNNENAQKRNALKGR